MASEAHKLIPQDPEKVTVVNKVAPTILTFASPFMRFGRIKIGGRATVVKLATGSTAIFSPVALTKSVRSEVEALGPIKYIVASDQEHHIFLEDWHKAYPDAKVLGPDSLPELRKKQNYFAIPDPRFHAAKKGERFLVDEDFDKEFDVEYVPAHANKELVFNHRPTRTLIEADLLFNLPATEQFSKSGVSATSGILTNLFVGINNVKSVWQQRFLWYMASAGDRPDFNKSVGVIEKWDFDRIIPCHGDIIETGGKSVFQSVFKWHLDALKKQ
ncbi:hypothetical protein AMS68_001862 [Peltaster fructicola]|uniref:Metallo-beta-lactamase domain-containing protein n=1 Tax=Peltaster fructicola TaxID=286661 RepID=A0A6H0XNY9_9PEZI|nr:hypothetical protein AMS68_001862 [Peltaster fructicola]